MWNERKSYAHSNQIQLAVGDGSFKTIWQLIKILHGINKKKKHEYVVEKFMFKI